MSVSLPLFGAFAVGVIVMLTMPSAVVAAVAGVFANVRREAVTETIAPETSYFAVLITLNVAVTVACLWLTVGVNATDAIAR